MKEKLIAEIRKEVNLLESWIKTTKYGGWSTQLIEPMQNRLSELKSLLYDISNEKLD
jgi:protein associated with RNAse G/E